MRVGQWLSPKVSVAAKATGKPQCGEWTGGSAGVGGGSLVRVGQWVSPKDAPWLEAMGKPQRGEGRLAAAPPPAGGLRRLDSMVC